jgi:hypothetical protein
VPTDGERLATVEAVLHEIRADVTELRTESLRSRTRLHNLEGVAGAFLDMQTQNRRREAEQYQRLGVRIQIAGIAIGIGAIIVPIIIALLLGK